MIGIVFGALALVMLLIFVPVFLSGGGAASAGARSVYRASSGATNAARDVRTEDLAPGWTTVRSGLGLMYGGMITMFLAVVGLVLSAMFVGATGANAVGATGIIVSGLAILVGTIVVLIGQCMCWSVPGDSNVKGLAIGAAVCLLVSIVLKLIDLDPVGSLASLVGNILFVLFLRGVAQYFHNEELAQSAGTFLAVTIAGSVGGGVLLVLFMFVGQSGGGLALLAFVGIAFLVFLATVFVWYLRLLRSTRDLITEAM